MVTRMIFPGENGQQGLTGLEECVGTEAPLAASGKEAGGVRLVSGAQEEQAVREFTSGERQRAQRFAIRTPLRYRTGGEGEWQQGMIVNISQSGVLFQTGQETGSNPAVEMRFSLSTGKLGEPAVQVVCRGKIVRAEIEAGSTKVRGLAARIIKFHFVRRGRTPAG